MLKSGDTWNDIIYVRDVAGNPVTGLVDGDFTKQAYKNGVADAEAVTVTELAQGRYLVSMLLNGEGAWSVWVTHPTYNPAGWSETLHVESKNIDDTAVAGTGDTAVTEDSGGAGNLAFKTAVGSGIGDADVRAYLKSDWDAGNRTDTYRRARTETTDTGGFQWPLWLDAGATYTLVYTKVGYKTATKEYTP